jgi:hypothetical protein
VRSDEAVDRERRLLARVEGAVARYTLVRLDVDDREDEARLRLAAHPGWPELAGEREVDDAAADGRDLHYPCVAPPKVNAPLKVRDMRR